MPDCCDTHLLEQLAVELRQCIPIDCIFLERGGVLPKAKRVEPLANTAHEQSLYPSHAVDAIALAYQTVAAVCQQRFRLLAIGAIQ